MNGSWHQWKPDHLGPDFHCKANAKRVREHRECVQHHSTKWIKERSEEFLNVKTLDYQSPSWPKINTVQRQRDQVGEGKSLCLRSFSSMCGYKKNRIQDPPMQNGQGNLKISKGIPHTKTQLVLMEKQLNLSGISQDLQQWLLSRRSKWTLERKNIEPENFWRKDHIYV